MTRALWGFAGCFAFLASMAQAEDIVLPTEAPAPPPFPTVESRTSLVPDADTVRRITVQINVPSIADEGPVEDVSGDRIETVSVQPDVIVEEHRDFWDQISPSRADTRPGRLTLAMDVLARMEEVRRPRLQTMQDIAVAHGVPILTSTVGTNISPALVLAVIAVESAGRVRAVSHAGAQGLMQLMPATARRFGVSDSFDPRQNISGGVAYLEWLMEEFDRDPMMVLASYNAGEGAVRKYDGVPPFVNPALRRVQPGCVRQKRPPIPGVFAFGCAQTGKAP